MSQELFKKIREGDEEEARKIFDNLMATNMRGTAVAIMARNFSHGVGKHALDFFKK